MGHAEDILQMLDAQRCRICGKQAVRGATICLACVADEAMLAEVLPQTAVDAGKVPRRAGSKRSSARTLRAAGT